ncbi:MAG: CBS domain-containing protein [Syntrophaceae bacterium]|nr:CBS domain-containing protein [Syntrophaceae bacterium]
MRIKDVMKRNPITVNSKTLVLDARKIMQENKIRRLPVVDKSKLVGIVTLHDLLEAAPSPAISLNIHELNFLLAKLTVEEVMTRNPVTLSPDTPFEDALRIGQEKRIGSFPVVENGKLVGISTESDIVRVLIRAFGIREDGSRITIEGLDKKDFNQINSIATQHDTVLLSMISWFREDKNDWMVVLRIKTEKPELIVQDLKKAGFKVTCVM